MKKSNGGKKDPPKPSPPKFQFSETAASSLVGSIVEKGIQEGPHSTLNAPSSSPNPTVLPFPVARHRSHGPHWGPPVNEIRRNIDENGEENGDSHKVDQIAAFAGPVKRKEQKSIDFRRWKEMLNDDSSASREKDGHKYISAGCKEKKKASERTQVSDEVNSHVTGGKKLHQELLPDFNANTAALTLVEMDSGPSNEISKKEIAKTRVEMEPGLLDGKSGKRQVENANKVSLESQIDAENRARLQGMSPSEIAEAQTEILTKMPSALIEILKNRGLQKLKKQNGSISEIPSKRVSTSPNSMGNGKQSKNLDLEIDAENYARLKRMSSDEIAEAQTEILEKMNPEAVEALRERGGEKLRQQQTYLLDNTAEGRISSSQGHKSLTKDEGSPCPESDISNGGDVTGEELDHNSTQNLSSDNSSYWDSWSKKVEAVRGFRFSLDAIILENDFFQVPKTGHVSAESGYTSNNVAERDFLRTEGDPAAAGYTIKEAVALARSVVPGQRAIALSLLGSIADKALQNFCSTQVTCNMQKTNSNGFIDWAAVWAYMLGPEPELALSLRMSLDDNHNSVVLASLNVIQCLLSCDINEVYFNISERVVPFPKDVCTSPVFRSRPEIGVGFLQGGFWKYNAKPSNVWPFGEDITSGETEDEHTIQDDMVVAGQDFVAGLVRMGILPRIRYLLETEPSVAMVESMVSILIAVARHSPTCASAIMMCEGLVQTVVDRFTTKELMEVNTCKIKSVTLLKVLARSEKEHCHHFIKNGAFRNVTWHLYQYSSLDQWLKLGREKCKLSSALLVEQLRFWKVCIQYGYCVSDFSDLFPALCLWLNVPSFERLVKNNALNEFAAITNEAFLVLGALSQSLRDFYLANESDQISEVAAEDAESWCWVHVSPMVDLALKWISLRTSPFMSEANNSDLLGKSSLLWVIASVLQMLSSVLDRVIPTDATISSVPWLPEFVPKVGLQIIENGFLNFSGTSTTEHANDSGECDSFTAYLCQMRHHGEMETSIAAVCCLQGLVRVAVSVDQMIYLAKSVTHLPPSSDNDSTSGAPSILAGGIVKSSTLEFRGVLDTFMNFVARDCRWLQSIEVSGRGGPAPGVGVGWGSEDGGYWSKKVLLAQADAGLINLLLESFKIMPTSDSPVGEEMNFAAQRISSALGACLVVTPQSDFIMDKLFDFLLQVPVLKYFDLCIRQLISVDKGLKPLGWYYKEEDFQLFGKILGSHFRSRWLTVKKKKKPNARDGNRSVKEKISKKVGNLDTIHEDLDTASSAIQNRKCTSLAVEWAHQRLPLPAHWFLSSISTINISKPTQGSASGEVGNVKDAGVSIEVAKSGLFFLLGIEAMSSFLSAEFLSPIRNVPITWKLHSLSVTLLLGMDVLEEKSRNIYETLQSVYGKLLDDSLSGNKITNSEDIEKSLAGTGERQSVEYLRFQSEIHETYSTFIDALVEQFSAVSYGDSVYGRQIAIYLHRSVETPVRLAAWTALSNAQVLELLPPLENCFARAEGYLEPMEDDEKILEAYAKSWVSGTLDKAVTRGSVAYKLALHHLTSFIFYDHVGDSLSIRNKLVKSLLRDFSRKEHHQGMMLDFIRYDTSGQRNSRRPIAHQPEVERRFKLLTEACNGITSLLHEVEKLKILIGRST